MAPPLPTFPRTALESHLPFLPSSNGKRRKPPVTADLSTCEPREMSQYFCELDGPREVAGSKALCEEFVRRFRV